MVNLYHCGCCWKCEKVASDLGLEGGFRQALRFPPPNHTGLSRLSHIVAEKMTKIKIPKKSSFWWPCIIMSRKFLTSQILPHLSIAGQDEKLTGHDNFMLSIEIVKIYMQHATFSLLSRAEAYACYFCLSCGNVLCLWSSPFINWNC